MNTARVILGFRQKIVDLDVLSGFKSAEEKALHSLKQAPPPGLPGFVSVIRRIRHLNAVVVVVHRKSEDEFIIAAPTFDPVEYCDKNVSLKTASYSESLPAAYRSGTDLAEALTKFHSPVPEWLAPNGLGTRVGLIDTGISAHPFLPSLTGAELSRKMSCMHMSIPRKKRESISSSISLAISQSGVEGIGLSYKGAFQPTNPNGTSNTNPLLTELQRFSASFISQAWQEWRQDMSDWLSKGRRNDRPKIPVHRNLFGAIRLVSPLSKTFLDGIEPASIADNNGHGTRMAGALFALRPGVRQASASAQLARTTPSPLLFDVVGLIPYAELVVLKCLNIEAEDDEDGLNGSLEAMISALSYCLDEGVNLDVLYIGLALKEAHLARPISIANLLSKLEKRGTVVFAPAGNGGSSGLAFPAALDSVNAITSVAVDADSGILDLAPYSNFADVSIHEEVTFCAYGGNKESPILTTAPASGFAGDFGTSIAAAIATGCYAAAAGALYEKRVLHEYDVLAGASGQISLDHVERAITNWEEADADRIALMNSVKSCAKSVAGAANAGSAQFGYGLAQVVDPALLP